MTRVRMCVLSPAARFPVERGGVVYHGALRPHTTCQPPRSEVRGSHDSLKLTTPARRSVQSFEEPHEKCGQQVFAELTSTMAPLRRARRRSEALNRSELRHLNLGRAGHRRRSLDTECSN